MIRPIQKILLLMALTATTLTTTAQRKETVLRDGWKFSRGEQFVTMNAIAPSLVGFNDSQWQAVQIPHDWAINGPFDKEIDKQTVAIEQNGEKQATEKTGRSGSLPWIGEGWYRTTFTVDKNCPHAYLNFDGAMSEPTVYVNGEVAAKWAYGYNAFRVPLSKYINLYNKSIDVVVKLENLEESSTLKAL